jgi:hypothetical protein
MAVLEPDIDFKQHSYFANFSSTSKDQNKQKFGAAGSKVNLMSMSLSGRLVTTSLTIRIKKIE